LRYSWTVVASSGFPRTLPEAALAT
jgi:hypothetical protein